MKILVDLDNGKHLDSFLSMGLHQLRTHPLQSHLANRAGRY